MELQERFKAFPLDKALDRNILMEMGLEFGLVYYLDEVILRKIEDIEIKKDRLIEARFFNEDKEIHIFKRDELEAILFEERLAEFETVEEPIKEEYFIVRNDEDRRIGDKLCIKNYISFDKDNQGFISYTRPYNVVWSGGGSIE